MTSFFLTSSNETIMTLIAYEKTRELFTRLGEHHQYFWRVRFSAYALTFFYLLIYLKGDMI